MLDVYRLAVLQVEQHLLHFPAPPLLTLQQFLAEFQVRHAQGEGCLNQMHVVRGGGA